MGHPSASGMPVTGQANGEGYAGDVEVDEAWNGLRSDEKSVLVDVRTTAEWNFVGVADLSELGKESILVEWQSYPTMAPNPAFVDDVAGAVPDREAPVYLLCRSGARSKAAAIALTQAGFKTCFNVSGGFEGPHDADRHRGSTDGWKARGLPWIQG